MKILEKIWNGLVLIGCVMIWAALLPAFFMEAVYQDEEQAEAEAHRKAVEQKTGETT